MSIEKQTLQSEFNYGEAILAGFDYLLSEHKDVFVIGQGLCHHGTLATP